MGTSAGGILAVAIAGLGYTAKQCVDLCLEMLPKVFPPSSFTGMAAEVIKQVLVGGAAYSEKPLEEFLRQKCGTSRKLSDAQTSAKVQFAFRNQPLKRSDFFISVLHG